MKGVDLAVYAAFEALGMEVKVRPVLLMGGTEAGGMPIEHLMRGELTEGKDYVESCLGLPTRADLLKEKSVYENYKELCDEDSEHGEFNEGFQELKREIGTDFFEVSLVGTDFHGIGIYIQDGDDMVKRKGHSVGQIGFANLVTLH